MYPYTGITFVIGCVIAYKLLRRLYAWNDAGIKRRGAERKGVELVQAIGEARQAAAIRAAAAPPPYRNPITGTAGEWDHIPRISFDLDTQLEFGGSRYHTFYVSPEDDCVLDAGLYITDKYEGPERIGDSRPKRTFIPYDQLIKR